MTPEQQKRMQLLREDAQKLIAADYFAALGITKAASPDDVRKAFVEAAKAWHPDRVPPGMDEIRPLFSKLFARLELARATLSDPARRSRYIEELAKPSTAATTGDISSAEASLEYRKAEALLKKHDIAGAEVHLRRATQLAPANVEYQVLLVWLQAKPDTTPEQLKALTMDLDRLIAKQATSERTYFYRGSLRKRQGLLKEAHADFVRAAELNPSNVEAAREVRIYNMRQEKAPGAVAKKKAEEETEGGVGGFFKKLFKR